MKNIKVVETRTRVIVIVVDDEAHQLLLEVTGSGLSAFSCEANGDFNMKEICARRDAVAEQEAAREIVARLGTEASRLKRVARTISSPTKTSTDALYVFVAYVSMTNLELAKHLRVLNFSISQQEKIDQFSPVHRAIISFAIDKALAKKGTLPEYDDFAYCLG